MLDMLLVIVILVFALQTVRTARLLTAAVWLAGVSALVSILCYRLGAPQVAAIELSIGAGLVTVLFVFAISISGEEATGEKPLIPELLAGFLALLGVILLGLFFLPITPSEVQSDGAPLAEIMWQQRTIDMYVQIVLIFSGVLGMLGLLSERKAPLEYPAVDEVAARRERELAVLEGQHLMYEEKV